MERHGDHRLDLGKIDLYNAVVVSYRTGSKFLVCCGTIVCLVPLLYGIICLPDGGQAGGLCGHNVDADSEIRGQLGYAGAHELHHLILYITLLEGCADDGKRHILRAYAPCHLALEVDRYHAGTCHIVSTL